MEKKGVNNMAKINTIVKVEERKVVRYDGSKEAIENECYNQGQEDYGNKEIGLDVGKIFEVIKKNNTIKELTPTKIALLATVLKDKEGEIIMEVEG